MTKMTQNAKPTRDEQEGRIKLKYFSRLSLKLQKVGWMEKHMEPEFHGEHRITLSLKCSHLCSAFLTNFLAEKL